MDSLISITLFVLFGTAFVFSNLTIGRLFRPKLPNANKSAIYECGEPAVGSSWVQFDLRFYIIALVYLVFEVEVALFYPWAVAWGDADRIAAQLGWKSAFEVRKIALLDLLFFFGVLIVGFAYLWRFGYLDWIRSAAASRVRADHQPGLDLSKEARRSGDFETEPAMQNIPPG